ncbi:MAG: DUF255 domain-containing protein [Chitinophagaceae bacterium]|nr:DUF255 domain-containing protein [Chitinophagaceae bacterium]
MKLLTGLVLSLVLALSAAATEITFEKSLTWKQIKEKAAKENKMIFFDAYTSWCGPCKYLENKVYTDDAVASYYNANYINVKFDMEDGEGISLAEELGSLLIQPCCSFRLKVKWYINLSVPWMLVNLSTWVKMHRIPPSNMLA